MLPIFGTPDWVLQAFTFLVILGFLFAAVAGYLVAMIGSSNNPISGLTLSALLISAVLMVLMGLTGVHGVAAVLGVAGVVCCAAGIAGDMMQDLKVGHLLGGTPWRMEIVLVLFAWQWLPLNKKKSMNKLR